MYQLFSRVMPEYKLICIGWGLKCFNAISGSYDFILNYNLKEFTAKINLFSWAVYQSTFVWSEVTGVDGAQPRRKGQITSDIRFLWKLNLDWWSLLKFYYFRLLRKIEEKKLFTKNIIHHRQGLLQWIYLCIVLY